MHYSFLIAAVLQRFSVQLLGDTAQVNFTFSTPQNLNNTRCFFDKLIISNSDNTSLPTYDSYQPLYPGLCWDTYNSYTVMAFLDPRDFRPSLEFFGNIDNLFFQPVPGMEINFLPRVSLLPFEDPLQASALTLNLNPRMESFDVDFNTNRILFHFTDYVDLLTFESIALTLTDPTNSTSYQLSNYSVPEMFEDNFVRTICILIDEADLAILESLYICTSIPERCACYFTSALVSSHSGIRIQNVQQMLPLPVS